MPVCATQQTFLQESHLHRRCVTNIEKQLPPVETVEARMKEIQATFQELGMTGNIFKGVSDMYHMIGATPIGNETPETQDQTRSLEQTITTIAHFIEESNS